MSVAQAVAQPVAVSRRLAIRFRPSRVVLNVVLILVALFWMVPTISLLVISFRPEGLYGVSGWWTVFTEPSQLTLQNYQSLLGTGLGTGGILDSLITTALITVPATALVTVIASLAAYSLVFGKWRGRTAVFLVIVGLLVVPVQVALIPVAQLYHAFGNLTGFNPYGTLPGVVIFHVAFGLPFGIFLMRNFYTGIPKDLLEAGRIDGAGEWTLFRRVVLPLGVPAAASLAIFQFIWVWNDLLVGLVFLGGNAHHTLTIFLYSQTRTLAASYWVIATGAMISIIVPLAIFFAFQRYFVRGVLAGAVK
ncbi:MAG TPA: carbohydrate ABC transporter permease [Candidatus Binatia bacterium]|nr:carbohydrate ABC transporter permease [Candidatus Binatia bacterium]